MHLTIDWANFTPTSALLGGALLGVAATLLVVFRGKIAGISGILAYLTNPRNAYDSDAGWRALFIIGLMSANWFYQLFATLPETSIVASNGTLITAGLLVGFGSRMGSGCSSGHGICGLSRLSLRSLVATLSFMLSGFLLTYVFLHAI